MGCWLFHKWSQWKITYQTDRGFPVQQRKCERCGKHQIEVMFP